MADLIPLGLLGLFCSAFLAGSVLPFPSEGVLAALVGQGESPWLAVGVATAGNVLGDITGHGRQGESNPPPVASATSLLRSAYRFAGDSAIAKLAGLVNNGDQAAALDLLGEGEAGLRWFDSDGEKLERETLDWLCDAYQPIFDSDSPAQALEVYDRTRLLCATNHGPFGIEALNRELSNALQARNGLAQAEHYRGLPIMISRNFPELELFNGDTGLLWPLGGELRACFRGIDGDIRDFAINRLPEFKPAWAITVHKSQGSEFDSVLLVLPQDASAEVLSRELLYTAITRARNRFLLHAPAGALTQAIGRTTRRHSGLALKLGWR